MKSLKQHVVEAFDRDLENAAVRRIVEAQIAYNQEELLDALKEGKFKSYIDLKEGDTLQLVNNPDESYTLVRKFVNIDTARSAVMGISNAPGAVIDDLFDESYKKALNTGPNYVSSLPVVLVQHNERNLILLYAPDKYEQVETAVCVYK